MQSRPGGRADHAAHITVSLVHFDGAHYHEALDAVLRAVRDVNPAAHVVVAAHQVRPVDLRGAAFLVKSQLSLCPAGIHLGLLYPTVESLESRTLVIACRRGLLLGPDNGILMPAARELGLEAVYEAKNPRFWPSPPSRIGQTLQVGASLAAHLSLGLLPEEAGPRVEEVVDLGEPAYRRAGRALEGEVVFIDRGGSLVTNIPRQDLARVARFNDLLDVVLADRPVRLPLLRRPRHAPRRSTFATLGDHGLLEISARGDNASRLLGAEEYGAVRVRRAAGGSAGLEGPA